MGNLQTINITQAPRVDFLIGNDNQVAPGNTVLISIDDLAVLLAGTAAIGLGVNSGLKVFKLKSDMDLDLEPEADFGAWVMLDPVPANNGTYAKLGATGVGSWDYIGPLPSEALVDIANTYTDGQIVIELNARTAADTVLSDRIDVVETDAVNGEALRPGDDVAAYTGLLNEGDRSALATLDAALLDTNADGAIVQIAGAGIVVPKDYYSIEPTRVYRARFAVRRKVDSTDPIGDAVRFAIAWYDNSKTRLTGNDAQSVIQDKNIKIADGRAYVQKSIGLNTAGTVDVVAPASAIYCLPYIETFGSTPTTEIELIDWQDVTDDYTKGVISPKANGPLANRGNFDDEDEGFIYLATDQSPWEFHIREGVAGNWQTSPDNAVLAKASADAAAASAVDADNSAGISTNQAGIATTQAGIALAVAQGAGASEWYVDKQSADLDFAGLADLSKIDVAVDETDLANYTRYQKQLPNPALVKLFNLPSLFNATHRTTTQLGFKHGSELQADLDTNDAIMSDVIAGFNRDPLMLWTDGEIFLGTGAKFHDWLRPIALSGTTDDAGFTCRTVGQIPFRVRGPLAGAGPLCPEITFEGLTFKGAWTAANNWVVGAAPYAGVQGESSWTKASAVEVARAANVRMVHVNAGDAEYDGVSGPYDIARIRLVYVHAENAHDDCINMGGLFDANTQFGILDAQLDYCSTKFGRHSGIHVSGGAFGARVNNSKSSFCGTFALDLVEDGIIVRNFHGHDIGQPHPNDPNYGNYPGGVDGFFEYGGGASAAHGVGFADRTKKQITLENVLIERLFDKLSLNDQPGKPPREQGGLDIANGTFMASQLNVRNYVLDNSGLDPAIYLNELVHPIIMSNAAGNDLIEDSNVQVKALYSANNPGGSAGVTSSGKRNTWDIYSLYGGSGATSTAMTISGEDIHNSKFVADKANKEISITGARFNRNNRVEFINANPNPIAVTNGIRVNAPDCEFTDVLLVDAQWVFGPSATGFKAFNTIYKGSAGQMPSFMYNKGGVAGLEFHGPQIYQEALDVGTTNNNLMQDNKGGVKIYDPTGYCRAPGNFIMKIDDAASTGFTIKGGEFESDRRILFETTAGGDHHISDLLLRSNITSGNEFTTNGDDCTCTNVTIKRGTSTVLEAFVMNGDGGACVNNLMLNSTAPTFSEGTGNSVDAQNTIVA